MEKSTYHHPKYESAVRRLAQIMEQKEREQAGGEVVLTFRLDQFGQPKTASVQHTEYLNN